MTEYRLVWQSWRMLRPTAHPVEQVTASEAVPRTDADDFRARVQQTRIARRWTVAAMASRVQCDEHTLAAYERGDEVLDREVLQRLRAIVQPNS